MSKSSLALKENEKLDNLLKEVKLNANFSLGYPFCKDFDYNELMPFLEYPMNNVGDPFTYSTYGVNSRELEKEVIQFFAELFRAKKDDWWGYVTNGGSEGNLYGMYLARELHPKGMAYYSESTHYSMQKNMHILNIPNIVISAQESGEIDYEDLENSIKMNRHIPVIINANIGTTMTEARDDIGKIKQILKKLAIQNYYIHADGALAGSYSAFLEPKPSFDFADGADSIAISGHKFIGAPMPSGVVIVKKSNRDRIARTISYIGNVDNTIAGSRSGHSPLYMWYTIKRLGIAGLKERLCDCLETAAYTEMSLNEIGIAAWRNTNTITVNFPEPDPLIRQKYQLASENGWSHIICMPGVSKEQIDQLIKDIVASKAFNSGSLATV